MSEDIIVDFTFLDGKWTVTNRKLKNRLTGSNEWAIFHLNYEHQTLLRGMTSIDRMYGEYDGIYFEGASVRTYNPKYNEWTIYWTDIDNPDLIENVRGRFDNGVGTFYGLEAYKGTRYLMRFIWRSLNAEQARWEQAFFDPVKSVWEINWIMDFERVAAS
ncbi:MAG: hypothetical protein DHS20C05_13710 [Hyphococcus sp.]|nr:MAG: hypothetical protein DHS20C05_13710 [Marinicaulis sp.]